jgi:hypothetical protein
MLKRIGILKFQAFSRTGPFFEKVRFLKFQWSRKEPPGVPGRHPNSGIPIAVLKSLCFSSFCTFYIFGGNVKNKEGIWIHGTHRRATGASPDTQILSCLKNIAMCEENRQKLAKIVKMQNPQEGEPPGSLKGVPGKLQGRPNGAKWGLRKTPGGI